VGESAEGSTNIIFLATDTPIPEKVQKEIEALPLVENIKLVEL